MSQFRPVYVDGPLEGEEFSLPEPLPVVYAHDPDGESITYQFRTFGFHMGGKVVAVEIGYCGGEPDAETFARALLKPEVFERAKVLDMPKDLTA